MMRARPCALGATILWFSAGALRGASGETLTLDEAIRAARQANARLPLAAKDLEIARQRVREARANRWLQLAIEGDFVAAPERAYDPIVSNLGEERLQVVGRQPLLDGGERRSALAIAEATEEAGAARYRIAEADLDLEVRTRFGEVLEADQEAGIRRGGIARLENYRTALRSRMASGQAVAADLLRTEVRLASEEAERLEAERRLGEARLALNDLLGREPEAPLDLAPLPAPGPGAPPDGADGRGAWERSPEIREAEAEFQAAIRGVDLLRAERRPHLMLAADAGLWGSDTTRLVPPDLAATDPDAGLSDRLRRDRGYSVTLALDWKVWDPGAYRARLAAARIAADEAAQERTVQERTARLNWTRARAAADNLARQIEILAAAEPRARDAYLEAESRYRGGHATALEVLDAFASAVDASLRLADATLRYRVARALVLRWGTP